MRRLETLLTIGLAVGTIFAAQPSSAQTGDEARGRSELPPGHPALDGPGTPAGPIRQGADEEEDDDGEEAPLPPGHPSTAANAAKPGAAPGTFTPPPDTENEDGALAPGTVSIELRDPENEVVPGADLTLGMIHQSVAKGESREHKTSTTNSRGVALFTGLETGSGIAYRLSVPKDGATFAAMPFQLSAQKGMRVILHVYPVSRSIQEALIVMQGVLFIEVKDDRVQIEEAFTVFNLGKVAWVADGTLIRLPEVFTALSAQQTMSDQGVDSVERQGGRLHGTFAPGRHEVQFRWQLPYSGDSAVDFEVGLPPHVAVMRVIAGAAHGSKLSVSGFPDAERRTDAQGQKLLLTEKQVRRDEPLASVHVTLSGLPTPGPGRVIATALAGLLVALGFSFAFGKTERPTAASSDKARRTQFLAEIVDLERARQEGVVGPKTYERRRRELIDAIASTIEPLAPQRLPGE